MPHIKSRGSWWGRQGVVGWPGTISVVEFAPRRSEQASPAESESDTRPAHGPARRSEQARPACQTMLGPWAVPAAASRHGPRDADMRRVAWRARRLRRSTAAEGTDLVGGRRQPLDGCRRHGAASRRERLPRSEIIRGKAARVITDKDRRLGLSPSRTRRDDSDYHEGQTTRIITDKDRRLGLSLIRTNERIEAGRREGL